MIPDFGDDLPTSDAPVAGSWLLLYEELVAGIVHSMNNAVTVLAVSLELSTPDDLTDTAVLRRELTQLVSLIALTSSISSRSTRDEALELRGVLDLAVAIHALNSSTRSVACVVHATEALPPVRVSRSALLRVLLLMIDDAKRSRGGVVADVIIEVAGDADTIVVRAPAGSNAPSGDALALASSCGGRLIVQEGRAVFALPSLASVRRVSRTNDPARDSATPRRATGS